MTEHEGAIRCLTVMRALALAGCVLLAAPAFACINGMNAEDKKRSDSELLVSKAAQKLDDRDYAGALKDAKKVLENDRSTPLAKKTARRVMGLSELRLGQLKEAKAHLLDALKESANEPLLVARLGEAEAGLGQFEEARKRLEELSAKMLLPDADAQVALAKARLAAGDSDGAKKAVAAALEQEPEHAGALAMKAQLEKPQPANAKKLPTRS
jgi:Tfp pilus assembly protein PilF